MSRTNKSFKCRSNQMLLNDANLFHLISDYSLQCKMPRNWLSWVSQPIYFPFDLCTTSDHSTPITNQANTKEISCSKWKLLNSLSRKRLLEFNVSTKCIKFFDYLKNTFYTTCLSSAIICTYLFHYGNYICPFRYRGEICQNVICKRRVWN